MALLPSFIPSMTALRCFDASAKLLSFTRAAEELHLTQSAVSHHILSLEKQLGLPLFVRRRKKLELTVAGRTYRNDISTMLRQLERATESIIATAGRGGSLNLSVASAFAIYWLVPRLPRFMASHPQITLNFSIRSGPLDFFVSHEDATIEFCYGAEPGIEATLVMCSVLYPYIARSLLNEYTDARRLKRIQKGRFLPIDELGGLLRSYKPIRRPMLLEAWPEWLNSVGLQDAVPQLYLNSGPCFALLSMAVDVAASGVGPILLPSYMAEEAAKKGNLVRLSEHYWVAPRAYYLRWPASRPMPAALVAFSDWLQSIAQMDAEPDAREL